MLALVTGFNNTGKTTWIADTISKEYNVYCQFQYYDAPGFNIEIGDYEAESFRESYFKIETDGNLLFSNGNTYFQYIEGIYKSTETCKCIYVNYSENGLHPSLHSKVIEEVIKLHKLGFDIYNETHSDHIVNAVRVAIKQGLIKCEDVNVLFFKAIDEIVEVKINQRGRIVEDCPDGFLTNTKLI